MICNYEKVNSLSELLDNHNIKDTKVRAKVTNLIALYILKLVKSNDFQRNIRKLVDITPQESIDIRNAVKNSSYVIKQIKLYILGVSISSKNNLNLETLKNNCIKLYGNYKIIKSDVILLFSSKIFFNKDLYGLINNFGGNKLKFVFKCKIADLCLKTIIDPVIAYAKKQVSKKLRFLMKSHNFSFDDLVNELMCKAVHSFYWEIPALKSKLHFINFLKQVCHNYCISIIKYFTAKKRCNMEKVESTYVVNTSEFDEEIHQELDFSIDKLENELSINNLIDKYKSSSTKSKILKLFMGHTDEGFSAWLREKKIVKGDITNDEYQSKSCTKAYLNAVVNYLSLSKRKVNQFLQSLRDDLSHCMVST